MPEPAPSPPSDQGSQTGAPAQPGASGPERRVLLAILAVLASTLAFTVMSALIKTLGRDFPMPQSIFIRSVVGIMVMLPLLRRSGGWASLRVRHVGWHVVRCCSGLFGTVSSFYGYVMLPLADVMALGFTMPLFLTVLAIPLLGERVGIRRATAVVAGFLGAVLIIRPEGGGETFALLFVLAGAVTWAISMIAIRRLGAMGESPVTIVIWFSAFAAAMSGLLLPFVWQAPTALQWAMLLLIGVSGGFGQLFISYAYRAGDVVLLAPFEYMALLWALGADILFWQAAPEWQMLIGAAILVASGLYILHREAKLGLARRRGAASGRASPPAAPADQRPG